MNLNKFMILSYKELRCFRFLSECDKEEAYKAKRCTRDNRMVEESKESRNGSI